MFPLLIFAFALLGLFAGSFLNVCIDRLPLGQSIIRPRSHCAACNHKLNNLNLIPIFSYLWLHGLCRYCQARIPIRLPIVEGITGLTFVLLYWKFGITLELVISLVYASLLIIIFVIDLERQLVLDRVVFPGMIIALVFSPFWPGIMGINALPGEALGRSVSSLAGGGLGLAAMAIPYILYRRGMGFGDVKLGALVGLMCGYPLVFVAILTSWIAGGLVAGILLTFKIKGLKDTIPTATIMTVFSMITLLWGQVIWHWYLG